MAQQQAAFEPRTPLSDERPASVRDYADTGALWRTRALWRRRALRLRGRLRERPGPWLAIAAMVGFALARVLRARERGHG